MHTAPGHTVLCRYAAGSTPVLVVLSEGLDVDRVRGVPLQPPCGNAGGFHGPILVCTNAFGIILTEHSRCLVSLSSKSPGLPENWHWSNTSRLALSRPFHGLSLPSDV